jgi:hypothetical protein
MAAIVSGGIASFKVDGVALPLRGSAKVKPQTSKKTAIANQDGSVVFTNIAVPPMMTLNISDYAGLSVTALTQIFGSTLTLALTNGKSYVMTDGTYVDEAEVNTEDGAISASFSGSTCNEIRPNS